MEMVATSKMKRAQERVMAARPFANVLTEVISSLYSSELAERFPLLRQPATVRRAAVLVLTSNRGLAGGFNSNIIKEARTVIAQLSEENIEVELHVVGRNAKGYYRYVGRAVASTRTDITDRPSVKDAGGLVDGLMDRFARGELDAVYVVSAKFRSALSTPPHTEKILPVTPPDRKGPSRDYLLFPSAEAILTELLPAYVRNVVYRALVENEAGFQGAQRTAMKNATDNATEILNLLRRNYNRARQANITQEISEIVGGAAALE
jgi:F-type H+-transporting ATPase subunit gamma